MAKKFKLKYLIVSLIIVAVTVSCTAFSVSYAKWVSSGKDSISVTVSTGTWGGWNTINDGIKIGDDIIELNGNNCPSENWFNIDATRIYCHFYIKVNKDTKMNFRFAKNDIIIIDSTTASVNGIEFTPTLNDADLETDGTVKFAADSYYEILYRFYFNYEVFKPELNITKISALSNLYIDLTGDTPIAKLGEVEQGRWVNGYYIPIS